MGVPSPNLQNKTLQRCKDANEYFLYKAALEWSLVDPIVIESRSDLKSEHLWRNLVEPYHHQVTNLITFCRRLPVTLLADDVGLGKTISAGLIVSELISRGRLSKILIVCPKILRPQWEEELKVKFNIPSVIVTGKELIKAKVPGDAGAVITTYQSARLYLDRIGQSGFEMLILDEAHKLLNLYGVDPAPQVALRFKKALEDRMFKYVLMLTATPIQNRLWDLYSLVDLLTVARGHENPFGSEGIFSRKFLADNKTEARKLRPEMKDEFRSIVYGYMSRVRRGDAKLHFPERVVQLHTVDPTPDELKLIQLVAEPIQKLNYFAQIIILQALVSSPEALDKVLERMAEKGTAPKTLAENVHEVVKHISITAKLKGLGTLIDGLKSEQPDTWRVVIFTRWRETQTTIQNFLEERGVTCGLINGDSGSRNQETIAKLKENPPSIHVIVSTEAGSEGVNLQAANVLVNYDLPWNPMIVEQRIGRIQRLSSNYANVSIFNIVLKDTFEEFIVSRLMQKLQMASQAIGDIEALLEASGVDEGDENGVGGFEEKIRQLVIASLAGKDIKEATAKAEKSIVEAQETLKSEEKNINSLLGGMNGVDAGPKSPKLPSTAYSMDAKSFSIAALIGMGTKLSPITDHLYESEIDGRKELIRFDNHPESGLTSTLCAPGTALFDRLINSIISNRWHRVDDIDQNPLEKASNLTQNWLAGFGGNFDSLRADKVKRIFNGSALLRVRATVAHDSYERLVELECKPDNYSVELDGDKLEPITDFIDNPDSVGATRDLLAERASFDPAISEFCRFYNERLSQEVHATGDNARLKKKMEDDFTPRLQIELVGLEGSVSRQLQLSVSYKIGSEKKYTSIITVVPSTGEIKSSPEMINCAKSGKTFPADAVGKCEISGLLVLQDLLTKSEISDRKAISEHIVTCTLTGKRILEDEAEKSSITNSLVTTSLLKTSKLSGKRAEPQYFGQCDFSSSDVLKSELAISQVSGKQYRIDEELRSVVSGKTGHKNEFIFCSETNQPLLATEAEKCEVTGKLVVPGTLQSCEVSGKMVLPSKLEKCAVTGKLALKKFFVASSFSGARLLESIALKSVSGDFCTPSESKLCQWSGRKCHPNDLIICELTGLSVHFEFATRKLPTRLETLVNLLDGIQRKSDLSDSWVGITKNIAVSINKGHCKIVVAEQSPDKKSLAVCLEVKEWLGLKTQYAGLIYRIEENLIAGRFVLGKRESSGWIRN
jgi:superfamily II DNA or RNA helicase